MDQAERIERIEDGRNAVLASSFLLQPVREAQEHIIKRLISMYRNGSINHDAVVGGIAEIAALYNLMKQLESTINQGNVAEEQEYK